LCGQDLISKGTTLPLSLSIAMCTFNGSRFLPAQLQSIASQTRLPDELVICDDASSDGSGSIVADFARGAPFPVRFIRNSSNIGSTRNFEKAISLCVGSIVTLADQDDVWYPHKLDRIEKALLTSPAAVAVFSDADLIDGDSRRLDGRLWKSFSFGTREQNQFANGDELKILVKHPVITGATLAFRNQFLELLLPIPTSQVHDTWITFLLAACGQLVPIAEPLMQYRRHQAQQIGPGRMTLRARFVQARNTGPQFYFDEIQRFHQLYERLESRRASFSRAERSLSEIKRKISHREHRARLPRASTARIPAVIREILNGGYWRYSEGWESVAKDVFGISAGHRSFE
jgi:glycosyltransferase involved in cell wall biosynthesis